MSNIARRRRLQPVGRGSGAPAAVVTSRPRLLQPVGRGSGAPAAAAVAPLSDAVAEVVPKNVCTCSLT